MQAPLKLTNLVARGVPMSEAKKICGITDENETAPVEDSGGSKTSETKSETAGATSSSEGGEPPKEPETPEQPKQPETETPPVADGDKPAWMP